MRALPFKQLNISKHKAIKSNNLTYMHGIRWIEYETTTSGSNQIINILT